MGNSGVIPPEPGFLQGLREITLDNDALLIFDEVITGFRVSAGGAQEHYLVQPDITVVSKAMASGYPVSAFGASREIMEMITSNKLFHGGVFSGNATVMAAAEVVLDELLANRETIYPYLYERATQLAEGMGAILSELDVPHVVQYAGPMISLFLTDGVPERMREYRDVRRHCDFEKFIDLQHNMQQRGIYFHPNQFEPMFLSTAHTAEDIEQVLALFEEAARCCLVNPQ
jgi:glutamate-1-semialdehyde 2,1-aminomutase